MRILIAEDDILSRLITEAAVAKLGHSVLTAADGEEAWRLCEHHEFDAIISDRAMPRMSGDELCRRLRAKPRTHYPYFIFLTAQSDKRLIVEGMEAGADDYLVKPFELGELAARLVVAARISDLYHDLAVKKAELERLNRQLFDQARIDPLTGLGTRLKLREDIEEIVASREADGRSYCAVMCDVDLFKQYNDTYGHPSGDKVLRRVANALIDGQRECDRAYRYGGEEFLIIMPVDSVKEGRAVAERHRAAVEALRIAHADSPNSILTVSMGLATAAAKDTATVNWIEEADAALYQAKKAGRNRVEVAPGSLNAPAVQPRRAPASRGHGPGSNSPRVDRLSAKQARSARASAGDRRTAG